MLTSTFLSTYMAIKILSLLYLLLLADYYYLLSYRFLGEIHSNILAFTRANVKLVKILFDY